MLDYKNIVHHNAHHRMKNTQTQRENVKSQLTKTQQSLPNCIRLAHRQLETPTAIKAKPP
jgi:hypothetical protein